MVSSTGTMSGNVVRFSPKSLMKSFDELSRAETCLACSTAVSRRYDLYESPIQQSRDLIKSAFIPASSSKTTAHTLIECDVNRIISSRVRSGWEIFAKDWSTAAILLAVRYFLMPWWLAKMPIGWSSDWPRRLARKKIRYCSDACHLQRKLWIDRFGGSFGFGKSSSFLWADLLSRRASVRSSGVLSYCRTANPEGWML